MSIQPETKSASVYEFSEYELILLIRGMRAVNVEPGTKHWDLLERFERELMRRFDVYIEDFGKHEEEEIAYVAALRASAINPEIETR